MHSGGSTALFPNKYWQFGPGRNHTPEPFQKKMYSHFLQCADYAKANSRGKRHIVIHDGDAIEGWHHGTVQVLTVNKGEQMEVHLELMDTFLRKSGYDGRKGDKLYYVNGTEIHTGETERKIAKDLKAQSAGEGREAFDFLELNVNGRLLWFVHHGPSKGKGANKGDPLRNWLKAIYWECVDERKPVPDVVVTGHTHNALYNTYVHDFHTIHGVILPSWQMKTRHVYKVAPIAVNEIGAAFLQVKADGTIVPPVVMKIETENMTKVRL
jgi:hypothetical protein